MAIFSHTNEDGGDSMDVHVTDRGTIEFHTAIHGKYGSSCRVPKEDALRLYAALGEALYPVHTPEGANRSLIEQLIDKAAQNAVAAALPLHLAQLPDRWGYVDANRPPLDFDNEEAPELCSIPGCMATGMPGTHFAHDAAPTTCAEAGEHRPQECPEPTTAGRWEAELRRDAGRSLAVPYCGNCGHSSLRHAPGGCYVPDCKCNRGGKP